MKHLLALALSVSSIAAYAEDSTFSVSRLKQFYETFFCEEKQSLSETSLTTSCSYIPPSPTPGPGPSPVDPVPPPNPGPPPFKSGYLPILLVNNSTLPDDEVFVVVTGKDQSTLTQSFLNIDASTGVGSLVTANPGDNATNYSLSLSQLPQTTAGRVFYSPTIVSSAIWISMQNQLSMSVNSPHSIVQPAYLSPNGDGNFYTNYDIFEYTYTTLTTPNVAADATAVTFFSLPLYGYISTPSSTNSNTGLYQPRSYIMQHVAATFAAHTSSPESSQWNNLFLTSAGNVLRILSTGKAMSNTPTPIFDDNYLDHASTYGYSYLNNIWTQSVLSFYRQNPLTMTIPNGSLDTYTGVVNSDNTITLTGNTHGYQVIFGAPTTSSPTTTFDIFSGLTLVTSDNSPGQADGVQLSKLFEEAIIAGLVPTADTLSNDYLAANQSNFYSINSNLNALGKTSGPWYDLYSKALHNLGYIYTFAYDEPLWPQVQIFSNTLQPDTYISVTIGSVE